MSQSTTLTRALTLVASAVALAGCGGGGSSGGGGNVQPTNDSGVHEPRGVPSGPARVAVIDTGYDLEALPEERLGQTLNVYSMEEDVSSGDTWHGTTVASVVAKDDNQAAILDLTQVTENNWASEGAINFGVGEAADRGARVINASFTGRTQLPHPNLTFNDINARESLERIIHSNGGYGSLYVVSAGNEGQALEAGSRPVYQHGELYRHMLIAGGSRDDGSARHPDSNYPGDSTEYQSRFLTAPYEWPELNAQGTSLSAPQISAYAAGLFEAWPHLTAPQVGQLLLDTASRHSSLYQDNSCGASGTANCGDYYLGQGEADIEAAFEPAGEVAVASGDRVDDGGEAPSQSVAQLSGAYGDAVVASGALRDVAVFDELGRDYRLDLSQHVSHRDQRSREMQSRMTRLSSASPEAPQHLDMRLGAYRLSASQNAYGETLASRFDARFGNSTWTAYRYAGGEVDPLSAYAESGLMPMLAFQGGADVPRSLEAVSGLKTEYAVSDSLALVAAHWSGDALAENSLLSGYRANRSDLGFAYDLTDTLTLTPLVGVMNESGGLLGAQGSGALALGEANRMTFGSLNLDYRLGDRLVAFAQYERGHGDMSGAGGLVRRIERIRAEEMAFGMQWNGDGQRAALALRQPLRLDRADATFDVPVGRTLEGEVIRDSRRVALSPSGRQQDIELGYALQATERSHLQLNLLYTLEPGHVREAPPEPSAMLNYTVTF